MKHNLDYSDPGAAVNFRGRPVHQPVHQPDRGADHSAGTAPAPRRHGQIPAGSGGGRPVTHHFLPAGHCGRTSCTGLQSSLPDREQHREVRYIRRPV